METWQRATLMPFQDVLPSQSRLTAGEKCGCHTLRSTRTRSDRHINSLAFSPVKTNKCSCHAASLRPVISSSRQNERQDSGRNPVRISMRGTSKHVHFYTGCRVTRCLPVRARIVEIRGNSSCKKCRGIITFQSMTLINRSGPKEISGARIWRDTFLDTFSHSSCGENERAHHQVCDGPLPRQLQMGMKVGWRGVGLGKG